MSRGEQEPKKSREEKKPMKPGDKNPSGRELDESELDRVAGGRQEQQVKIGGAEQDGKTVS